MKLIDKKGKLFGRIHIFDIVVILVFIAVILGAMNKFSSGNIISFDGGSKKVHVTYWVETNEYRPEYLETLKVGDVLSEDKTYLDAKITDVKIIDDNITRVDNNGNIVVGPHPFYKRALVQVDGTLDYKEPLYDLGKQEVRVGAVIFLTTDKVDLSVVVTDFQVVQD